MITQPPSEKPEYSYTKSPLDAIPGETAAQYEARLGASKTTSPGQGFGTPTQNFATSPAPLPNGSQPAPIDPLSPAGIALKNSLEDHANAEGNGLNNVPTKGSTPPDTNKFSLSDVITSLGPKPVAPDTAAIQSGAESSVGLSAIQSTLQQQNDEYTKLQNDIQSRQASEASKPGVVATLINGRIRMISAQDSKVLSDLKANIASTTRQLTQANQAVQTIMKNAQTDYNNAEKQYQDSFNDAMKVYSAEETQQNKAQTTAKANAQVIINSYKGSSTGFNSITDDQKAQWSALEIQAGLPPGTIEAAVRAELNVQKFVKGSDGNMYVTGTDANGVPYTAKVVGSQGSGGGSNSDSGGGWTKAQLGSWTSKMSSQLDSLKGTDGMVSNGDWNAALSDWVNNGGTTAQFNTAFKSYKSTNKG